MEWHGVLAAEKARVVFAGAGGEGFDAGAGGEGGCWFVESDMPVGANPEKLKIDSASALNFFLVFTAVLFGIRAHSIGDVDVCGMDVHMLEKVPVHEGVVGLRMLRADPDVFIEVETRDARPVEVSVDKFAIEGQGCGAGG